MLSFKELMDNHDDDLDISDFEHHSKVHQPSPQITGNQKIDILRSFQVAFGQVKVEDLKIQPILIPKNVMMAKIELLYEKQIEIVLKKKNIRALDFLTTANEHFREKLRNSHLYSYQVLSNVLYSAHKHNANPEVAAFIGFIHNHQDFYRTFFYLYLRQFVKIVGHVNFLAHQKSEKDPYKITLPYDLCIQIIRAAFFSDEELSDRSLKHFKTICYVRQPVEYYTFLTTLYELDFDFKQLPMLDILAALYAQKKPEELKKLLLNFSSQPIARKVNANEEIFNKAQPDSEFDYQAEVQKLTEKYEEAVDDEQNSLHEMSDNDRAALLERNEKLLFKLVKDELRDFSKAFTDNYISKNRPPSKNLLRTKVEGISYQIYKKLFSLTVAVFLNNRAKFVKIIRSNGDSEQALLNNWLEITELVKQLKTLNLSNPEIAQEFLNVLIGFPSLQEHMNFFLDFHLKGDFNALIA
jgi:hypothetical protein